MKKTLLLLVLLLILVVGVLFSVARPLAPKVSAYGDTHCWCEYRGNGIWCYRCCDALGCYDLYCDSSCP